MLNFIFKHLQRISLFCVIAVMTAIFLFSAQSAQDSSRLSGEFVEIIIKIFVPDFHNLSFLQQQEILDNIGFVVRKIAHFTEFTFLGFFLMLYSITIGNILERTEYKILYRFVTVWLFGTFYAVTDEIHQSFVSGRYSSIYDVLIDSSGVLCGIFILLILLPFITKRLSRTK
ncbi:MAG: VanZ family protein [Endomicrobiaceae bacterium]|nr:VanZ family protein [Endomicrobiaceae bacterium]